MTTLSERAEIRRRRRQDPNETAAVLARVCPDEGVRRSLESLMAASIEVAHQVGPAAWEVTLNYSRLRGEVKYGPAQVRGAHVTPDSRGGQAIIRHLTRG